MKFQVVPDRRTEQIICADMFNGKSHDGTIFKASLHVNPSVIVLGDIGYRGIQKVHANTLPPVRHKEDIAKPSGEEKAMRKVWNRLISSVRMKVEHVIGRIKVFRIVAEKYRNHRKRLSMGFNLICGIVNFERMLRV